jgi:membrane-bound lytic murein transglycosylase A
MQNQTIQIGHWWRQTVLIDSSASLKMFCFLLAGLAMLSSACSIQSFSNYDSQREIDHKLHLDEVSFKKIPGWVADNHSEALVAFLKSCGSLKSSSLKIKLGEERVSIDTGDWQTACTAGANVKKGSKIESQYFFETHFTPYLVTNNSEPTGMFTGYYEPELQGSWQPSSKYQYPIYGRPKDLVSIDLGTFRSELLGTQLAGRRYKNKIIPYHTRAEINGGALKGKQLELLWVDSAIEAFFLHSQGSGQIIFSDGSSVRIGFVGRNGQRYTPIGRELVARKVLNPEQVSLQSIQAWLIANPLAGLKLMEKNKAFIFFRILKEKGPVGAQGVVLTPGRSLAVDRKYLPLGLPIWLVTTQPGKTNKPLRRLVISQDTGSAIKGPVRGDLFIGHGFKAGRIAGQMKQLGKYYLLLPK